MKTSNEVLTYSRFVDGYVFFNPLLPQCKYYLNAARTEIYNSIDKSTVCKVDHINHKSFEGSYLLLYKTARCIFQYSDFIAIVPEE